MVDVRVISQEEFAQRSAQLIEEKILEVLSTNDRCVLGIGGGSTPRPVYELLGNSKTIAWDNVWIYLTDERYVPREHPESNQSMVRETLLAHAAVPEEQILFPDVSLQLDECILQYEQSLSGLLRENGTDSLVLGMGEDGHIASLFPPLPDAALSADHVVMHTQTDSFAVRDRISVTMPVLQEARSRFLLLGANKRKTWEKVQSANLDVRRWPVQALLDENVTIIVPN